MLNKSMSVLMSALTLTASVSTNSVSSRANDLSSGNSSEVVSGQIGIDNSISPKHDDYTLIWDGKVHCFGKWDNKLRAAIHQSQNGNLLIVQTNHGLYRIDDPSIVDRVGALLEPVFKLGDKQTELGRAQILLGSQQSALGHEQARLGHQSKLLSAKNQAGLSSKVEQMNQSMNTLADQQNQLAIQQNELGHEQNVLAKQQDLELKKATPLVNSLIDEAFSKKLVLQFH